MKDGAVRIPMRDFIRWSGGEGCGRLPEYFKGVQIDSRKITGGELFVALSTERRDGHDFVQRAMESGAAAALVRGEEAWHCPDAGLGLVRCKDPAAALARAAAEYRKTFKGVIGAVTGSCGKTTVKELTAAFMRAGGATASTKANLNNNLGLPVSILESNSSVRYGIFECGTNHPGEIAFLRDILVPDFAIITCIGTAHIEFFKTREGIAEEKGSIMAALPAGGFAVLDRDGDFFDMLAKNNPARTVSVSLKDPEADFYGEILDVDCGRVKICERGCKAVVIESSLPGVYNATNLLLAYAAARNAGVQADECAGALAGFVLPGSRWERKTINGVLWIDDSYNANPDSMKAALGTFSKMQTQGRKIAVLGDMGELGDKSAAYHAEVGKAVAAAGADVFAAVGASMCSLAAPQARSAGIETFEFKSAEQAKEFLGAFVRPGDAVLLKGSHAVGLERIVP